MHTMNAPDHSDTAPAPASLVPGARIRVVRGPLAGLTGRIVRPTAEGKLFLDIDNLPPGVHVVLAARALESLP